MSRLLLLIVFSSLSAYGQIDSIYNAKNVLVAVHEKIGDTVKVTNFYPNGTVAEEGAMIDSLPTGFWTRYERTGSKKDVIRYSIVKLHDLPDTGSYTVTYQSMKDGSAIFYFPNGLVRESGYYAIGKKHKTWVSYYPNGEFRETGTYDRGKKNGKWSFYHRDGALKEEGEYQNDRRLGEWSVYLKNGQVYGTGLFENGARMGEWKWYHDNGQLESVGEYLADMKTGEWKFYHANGVLMRQGSYNSDKRTGVWKEYDDKGELAMEGSYENDKKSGEWKERELITVRPLVYGNWTIGNYVEDKKEGLWIEKYPTDDVKYEWTYKEGELNEVNAAYTRRGKKLDPGTLKDGDGSVLLYNSEGELLNTLTYKDGQKLSNE